MLQTPGRHGPLSAILPLMGLWLLCSCGGGSSPTTRYVITDLTPDSRIATAYGINDSGQVVGAYHDVDNRQQPFLWTSKKGRQDLGKVSQDTQGIAFAINGRGQLVGEEDVASTFSATLWDSTGAVTSLGNFDQFLQARAINDQGQVVGMSDTGGYLWSSSRQPQNLNTLVGTVVTAVGGINARGQIAARTAGRIDGAVVYTPGSPLATIPIPAGFATVTPTGINDQGTVVGRIEQSDFSIAPPNPAYPAEVGFVWTPEKGVAEIGPEAMPDAINNQNQVVGAYDNHAFVWNAQTGRTDLNTLIPTGTGWELVEATALNDKGQIVGVGSINGDQHAFLLTPQ